MDTTNTRKTPVAAAVYVPLSELHPWADNPRINEAAVDQVAESLRRFGFGSLILARLNGEIIAGHTRFKAAQRLGLAEVPVRYLDLSLEEARALSLADNRLGEIAEWDDEKLAAVLADLKAQEVDVTGLGWDDDELRALMAGLDGGVAAADVVEDEAPPVPEKAFSKRGDLWILGNHRLLCGSCTSREDVTRLMAGERAQLFATDPPYLVGYNGMNHPASAANGGKANANKDHSSTYGQTWDEEDAEGNDTLWFDCFKLAREVAIKDNAAWYCWYASSWHTKLEAVWTEVGAFVHQQILWVKDGGVLTYSWYTWAHEPCVMGWVRPHKPFRNPEKKMLSSVWTASRPRSAEAMGHPTSKPVVLFAIPMEQHLLPGQLCYEPFSGSGTQIIAAEQTGRRCFATEIAPQYVDVAVRRWCLLTGREAVRDGDGVVFPMVDVATDAGVDPPVDG